MRKNFMAGAALTALLMMTAPVAAQEDIIVFGGEFEDEAPAPRKKPEPIRELPPEPEPPVETPAPVDEPEPPAQIVQPVEEPTQPSEPEEPVDSWNDDSTFDDLNPLPEQVPADEQPSEPEQPVDTWNDDSTFDDLNPLPEQVPADEQPSEPEQPVDTWNDDLVFDDLNNLPEQVPVDEPADVSEPPTEIERPFEQPTPLSSVEPIVIVPPTPQSPKPAFEPPPPVEVEKPARKSDTPRQTILRQPTPRRSAPSSTRNLKVLKPRFVKLAVDETYTYYLDKSSVQWRKMPYSSSEYIADVWIRMVEREAAPLAEDMAAYGADNFNAEVSLAAEQGYRYSPEDLQVLGSQAYVLEHYYLRPKTNQIQFLCELEVFGRPQNTINERAYDYKNWENLVPGSVESVIYATVLKTIGTKKATERGHMTFIDMLEEYGRISLR